MLSDGGCDDSDDVMLILVVVNCDKGGANCIANSTEVQLAIQSHISRG
jgi:hypothetical protein